MKPHSQDGYFAQGAANDAGYPFMTDQLPGNPNPTNFPLFLQGADTGQNNQQATPIWRLCSCGISYADQTELHLTIVLRRIPSA